MTSLGSRIGGLANGGGSAGAGGGGAGTGKRKRAKRKRMASEATTAGSKDGGEDGGSVVGSKEGGGKGEGEGRRRRADEEEEWEEEEEADVWTQPWLERVGPTPGANKEQRCVDFVFCVVRSMRTAHGAYTSTGR